MATTAPAVQSAIITAIEALTPAALDDSPIEFRHYDLERKYENAMIDQPAHCFRKFFVDYDPAPQSADVVNGSSGRWRYPFSLTVAYPRNKYGNATTPRAVRTAIDADTRLLIPVLRDCVLAAYVAEDASFELDEDTDEHVTFLRFGAVFEFWTEV